MLGIQMFYKKEAQISFAPQTYICVIWEFALLYMLKTVRIKSEMSLNLTESLSTLHWRMQSWPINQIRWRGLNEEEFVTWKAMEFAKARKIRRGKDALYDLWLQSLWAPAVMPRALNKQHP